MYKVAKTLIIMINEQNSTLKNMFTFLLISLRKISSRVILQMQEPYISSLQELLTEYIGGILMMIYQKAFYYFKPGKVLFTGQILATKEMQIHSLISDACRVFSPEL